MNRIFGIALITLFLTSFTYAPAEAKTVKKEKKQDVIILDVEKIETLFKKDDDDDKDNVNDNVDVEFSIFDNLIDKDKQSQHPFKIE